MPTDGGVGPKLFVYVAHLEKHELRSIYINHFSIPNDLSDDEFNKAFTEKVNKIIEGAFQDDWKISEYPAPIMYTIDLNKVDNASTNTH